tara:strand:- start:2818 stop:3018 length:201 start_codon:yes stop_codon:yes gene_type:complete
MISNDDEIEFLNAQLDYMAKELRKEKAFNKALQADNDRLHDLLDNSEDNVKRVSLLMSELKLNGSI